VSQGKTHEINPTTPLVGWREESGKKLLDSSGFFQRIAANLRLRKTRLRGFLELRRLPPCLKIRRHPNLLLAFPAAVNP
jgi:hypothetical protein